MGLIISQFKKDGHTFNNVYAKVNKVQVDNNNKLLTFDVVVTPAKGDNNIIHKTAPMAAMLVPEVDVVAQCYNSLQSKITSKKAEITQLTAAIDSETDEQVKIRKIKQLDVAKNSEVLQLEGTIEE